ncbi:MAG: hypothetical protein ABIR08_11110 [Sphingomonas sp.]
MGAQRKLADPALTATPAEAGASERVTPVDYQSPPAGTGDHPVSPAILLQEQLAARLAGADAGEAPAQGVVDAPEVKLPMALRIVTIIALSLALWGGIVLTAAAVLT